MKKLSLQLLIALLLTACAKNTDEMLCASDQEAENVTHTITMNFNGNIQQFEQTRATTTFANNTIMYVSFTNSGGANVYGIATYKSSIGNWEITYYGNLNNQTNSTCTIYHFVDVVDGEINHDPFQAFIILNKSSITYKGTGTFTKTPSSLNVTCNLTPNCSRIRFKGTSGKTIKIKGFGYFNSFDMSSNSLGISSIDPTNEISSTVESSGYTPYIYYNKCADNISITADGATYTMQAPSGMQSYDGKGGYLTIPTSTSHVGWTTEGGESSAVKRTFTANGVSFDMILVEHGTFTMGATSEQGSDAYDAEKPAHQVTLTKDYYIGETEVTQALWKAVTGYSPTSDGSSWTTSYGFGNNYPAYYISYNDVQSFITKLNSLTGKNFRMPTEAEWEFAARGGNKSKGYKYSGSNTIDDVAWYTDNSNSTTQPVKTKSPNELGIYDMSGNVWEWCSDWYGSYSSSSQTNPTGATSGSYRVSRGGSWGSIARRCRVSYRFDGGPDGRDFNLGFRLALSE